MKILYAIQGTGNGHIARAEEIVPFLFSYGKVDLFVSGAQADIQLPFPVRYKSKGLSFYFGKKGGIDFLQTFRKNNTRSVWREIRNFPVEDYDVVINDFEAISAWACKHRGVPCFALSHQFALGSPKVPRPKHYDPIGGWFLNNYAPVEKGIGFHFHEWDKFILTPVIRERIRTATNKDQGHYTVYLPAYEERKVLRILSHFKGVKWHIFSKHASKAYTEGSIRVSPIDNSAFTESLASSTGVLCGAGFETPAEALYMRKKLLVIPMKNQYEQHYNAAGLNKIGVPVMKKLSVNHLDILTSWVESNKRVNVKFPETAEVALEKLFKMIER